MRGAVSTVKLEVQESEMDGVAGSSMLLDHPPSSFAGDKFTTIKTTRAIEYRQATLPVSRVCCQGETRSLREDNLRGVGFGS